MRAVAIIVPVACFVLIFGIVSTVLYAGVRRERQRQETLRAFVEKGAPIPPELLVSQVTRSDLRRGIVLIATGVGLGIVLALVTPKPELASLGALPGLIGVGYLVAWKLERPTELSSRPLPKS